VRAAIAGVAKGMYEALTAAAIGWPGYSGTVAGSVTAAAGYWRVGECRERANSTMGVKGSEVVVPIHFFKADRSNVAALEKAEAAAAALSSDQTAGAVTVAGRTVADVECEAIEDVGADDESGAPVQHVIATFIVWMR
jgi:hypothetical protein